jgi:geranylgeranyl reductase family protein
MSKQYDVVIVGGGPIGSSVAGTIAKKGYNVAIIEKKRQIGLPLNCAGLITQRVFDLIPIASEKIIQNKIKGAHIHSPSGHILKIGGDKTHAIVIDRYAFDNALVSQAQDNGTDLYLQNKVIAIQRIKEKVELSTTQEMEFHCDLVIGADGPFSGIRDRFSLPQPKEYLHGLGAEIDNITIDPNNVEIYLGSNTAPGFFAWIIPTNSDGTTARIGLCTHSKAPHSPLHYLNNFMSNKSISIFKQKPIIIQKIGGIIPLGVLKATHTDHAMIVGDAAAQIKPTSGGGLYPGLLSATHCSQTALEALEKRNFSTSFLEQYHHQWFSEIGKELIMGMRFRRLFTSLSDKQLDKYIEKFQQPKISAIITSNGDIDYPSKLVRPLIKKMPSLISLLPNLIKNK